nr:hypothetical protein [uncultured Nitrososphaera sp.]
MTKVLDAEDLKELRRIWDLLHDSPARQLVSLTSPEILTDQWNAKCKWLAEKYGIDQMNSSFNLQTGEINEGSKS